MKVKICGIYKITNPLKRIYIGQSIDINHRFKKYRLLTGGLQGQTRLFRSLSKYGHRKHLFEIIHICEREELNGLESYYISLFSTFNSKHGLNLTSGGDTFKMSEETKKRISHAKKNSSSETRKKIADSQIGNKNMLGKKHSEETKRKIRESKVGKKASEATKLKMSITRKKNKIVVSESGMKKIIEANKGNSNWKNNILFKGHPQYKYKNNA